MGVYTCLNKCCKINVDPYFGSFGRKIKTKKAGIFIIDKDTGKLLVVQSRGNLWGIPKGSFKKGETSRECAIREVEEETGIEISMNQLDNNFLNIKNNAFYYYLELNEVPISIQTNLPDNDVNGISWIKVSCLVELVENGYIKLNKHCKISLKHFLDIDIQSSQVNTDKVKNFPDISSPIQNMLEF
jgi:ADP-ribose pyrophosphatase YjhB (NUDIX family)